MKCVILAAGIAKRLRPLTLDTPKCLLKIGGKPILQRIIENVLAAGIHEIGVVTGFGERKIQSLVRRKFGSGACTFICNPRFRATNNAYSLFLARTFVSGAPFLLLDSDILFGSRLLKTLLNVPRRPNRLAVRVTGRHDEEEIRIKINRWDHIRQIGKHVPLRETYGESIGVEIFSPPAAMQLFEVLERRIKNGKGRTEFYEAAFQELIDGGTKLWAVDIGSMPAVEIDTPEDLARAVQLAGSWNETAHF